MSAFEIVGRCCAAPPPQDWREQLAARLGSRPRRIGVWSELALYGALECMAAAGETALPKDANVLVASQHASRSATLAALEQGREELPMPLTFLQTQPSQMLAVLAAHLGWSGNARFISSRHPHDVLRLAAAQAGTAGVLLGWVDEMEQGRTTWLRLRPVDVGSNGFRAARAEDIFSSDARHLRITSSGPDVLIK